jgi:hypothetical protein
MQVSATALPSSRQTGPSSQIGLQWMGERSVIPRAPITSKWRSAGKRIRLSVGRDAQQAGLRQQRKQAELNAVSKGVSVKPEHNGNDPSKRSLAGAVSEFREEVQLNGQKKTWKGYDVALNYFLDSCEKQHIEDIAKVDLLRFAAFLREKKNQSPRSVHNKLACVLTFLTANGVPKLLSRGDRPRYVNEQVEIYEDGELEALDPVCSRYHATLYKFLLMTGLREKEAMYCTWNDVNLKVGTSNMLETAVRFPAESVPRT